MEFFDISDPGIYTCAHGPGHKKMEGFEKIPPHEKRVGKWRWALNACRPPPSPAKSSQNALNDVRRYHTGILCHTTGWTKLKFMANCRQETGWKGGIRERVGRVNVFLPLLFPHRSHLRVSEIPEASLTHISHLQHGTSAHFMTAETAQPNFIRVF